MDNRNPTNPVDDEISKPKTLAETIRIVRLGLGESLDEFAGRFDKSANAAWHWEKGDQANIPAEVAFWLLDSVQFCETCKGKGFTIHER